MKKKTATFIFESVIDGPGIIKKTASVLLSVNYEDKRFIVTPTTGDNTFGFAGTSDASAEWLATVECLRQAIEFGRKEVGQDPKVMPAPICQECQKSF